MKFTVEIEGDLGKLMRREVLAGERAVTGAMRAAGSALKADWRAQITGSGLGGKVSNAVRDSVYPKGAPSLSAAALVYSKAPKITAAHDAGPVIRSTSGLWLAIPLPAAGVGARGKKLTPGEWQFRNGIRLQFVKTRRGAMLVANAREMGPVGQGRAVKNRRKVRKDGIQTGAASIPIFVLVPQVKLPKRLNLYPAAERIATGLPGAIVANWRE